MYPSSGGISTIYENLPSSLMTLFWCGPCSGAVSCPRHAVVAARSGDRAPTGRHHREYQARSRLDQSCHDKQILGFHANGRFHLSACQPANEREEFEFCFHVLFPVDSFIWFALRSFHQLDLARTPGLVGTPRIRRSGPCVPDWRITRLPLPSFPRLPRPPWQRRAQSLTLTRPHRWRLYLPSTSDRLPRSDSPGSGQ
jgi:hypothetical protein